MEVMLVAILCGLNIFQIIYWSRQVQKLIDKLMSRNYAEYNQSHITPTPKFEVKVQDDAEDMSALQSFRP